MQPPGSDIFGSLVDARREVGLFAKDPKVVKRMLELFETDWARTEIGQKELKVAEKVQEEEEEEEDADLPRSSTPRSAASARNP